MAKFNISMFLLLVGFTNILGYELFNGKESVCCDGDTYKSQFGPQASISCCNNKGGKVFLYDTDDHVCCDGELFEKENKNEDYECCGGKPISLNEAVCCGGKPLPNYLGLGCCADEEPYNITLKLCCHQATVNEDDSIVVNYKLFDLENDDEREYLACCHMTPFDERTDVCCSKENEVRSIPEGMEEEEYLQCCGDNYITDLLTQTCKDGNIIELPSGNHVLCGDEIYEKYLDQECCLMAGTTYNITTQVCCGDEVVTLTDEDVAYNRDSCCYKEVVSNKDLLKMTLFI